VLTLGPPAREERERYWGKNISLRNKHCNLLALKLVTTKTYSSHFCSLDYIFTTVKLFHPFLWVSFLCLLLLCFPSNFKCLYFPRNWMESTLKNRVLLNTHTEHFTLQIALYSFIYKCKCGLNNHKTELKQVY
jgi:hypothetical protein